MVLIGPLYFEKVSNLEKSYRNTTEGGFIGESLKEMDDNVGKILENLKKNNIEDNTILVFLSGSIAFYLDCSIIFFLDNFWDIFHLGHYLGKSLRKVAKIWHF